MSAEQGLLENDQPIAWTSRIANVWHTIVVLFKLRIVVLLLLTAFGGAMLGVMATGQNSWQAWVVLTIAGILSAAGASAINQYWERDIDKKMKRTANRPLATGEINNPQWVLWAGTGLITIATGIAAMWSLSLAFWIALGAFIYVVVYTIWLKPRTRLNIVIGGAAGSCAVLSGGAAFGAWADPAVIVLALTLFVWTPVHFWALALVHRQDYVDANYPMLPAQVPATTAARWTAFHGLLTVIGGLALSFVPTFDIWFLVPVGVASAMFLKLNWLMVRNPTPKTALPLFIFSNLYLTIILVMLLLAPIWR